MKAVKRIWDELEESFGGYVGLATFIVFLLAMFDDDQELMNITAGFAFLVLLPWAVFSLLEDDWGDEPLLQRLGWVAFMSVCWSGFLLVLSMMQRCS